MSEAAWKTPYSNSSSKANLNKFKVEKTNKRIRAKQSKTEIKKSRSNFVLYKQKNATIKVNVNIPTWSRVKIRKTTRKMIQDEFKNMVLILLSVLSELRAKSRRRRIGETYADGHAINPDWYIE